MTFYNKKEQQIMDVTRFGKNDLKLDLGAPSAVLTRDEALELVKLLMDGVHKIDEDFRQMARKRAATM